MEEAWTQFSKPEHFGMDFPGIRPLQRIHGRIHRPRRSFFEGTGNSKSFANRFANDGKDHKSLRDASAKYVERFCFFFQRNFFLTKALTVITQESHPEFIGSVKQLTVVWKAYLQAVQDVKSGCEPVESEDEDGGPLHWMYDEDTFELNLDRVEALFRFAEIL